jgi:hypothetical protein
MKVVGHKTSDRHVPGDISKEHGIFANERYDFFLFWSYFQNHKQKEGTHLRSNLSLNSGFIRASGGCTTRWLQ